jgi:hypothetical protein
MYSKLGISINKLMEGEKRKVDHVAIFFCEYKLIIDNLDTDELLSSSIRPNRSFSINETKQIDILVWAIIQLFEGLGTSSGDKLKRINPLSN